MSNRSFSRRDVLIGAGAATLAGLTGCDSAASSFLSGSTNSAAGVSPFSRMLPNVVVSQPTGAAIQSAINSIGPGGGTINLTAKTPYIIEDALVIAKNNIKLVGRGPGSTILRAKKGAVLSVPGHPEEYLLLIQSSSGISILDLEIDTVNEANISGNQRRGIGAWNSSTVKIRSVGFVDNLGPNAFNQSLSFNQCSSFEIDQCEISRSRTGISVFKSTSFRILGCKIQQCEIEAPSFSGPVAAMLIASSSSGSITSSFVNKNQVSGSMIVKSSSDLAIGSCRISKTLAFSGRPENPGIAIEDCNLHRVTVDRCSIQQNTGPGIAVNSSTGVTIKENTLAQNGTPGNGGPAIRMSGTQNVLVTLNHVSDNRGPDYPGIAAGLSSVTDSGGMITGNAVRGFGSGVTLGSNSQSFTVEDNDLRSNTQCVVNDGSGNTVENNQC